MVTGYRSSVEQSQSSVKRDHYRRSAQRECAAAAFNSGCSAIRGKEAGKSRRDGETGGFRDGAHQAGNRQARSVEVYWVAASADCR